VFDKFKDRIGIYFIKLYIQNRLNHSLPHYYFYSILLLLKAPSKFNMFHCINSKIINKIINKFNNLVVQS